MIHKGPLDTDESLGGYRDSLAKLVRDSIRASRYGVEFLRS